MQAEYNELMVLYRALASATELKLENNSKLCQTLQGITPVASEGFASDCVKDEGLSLLTHGSRLSEGPTTPGQDILGGIFNLTNENDDDFLFSQGLLEIINEDSKGRTDSLATQSCFGIPNGASGSNSNSAASPQLSAGSSGAIKPKVSSELAEWRSGFVPVAPLLAGFDTVAEIDQVFTRI